MFYSIGHLVCAPERGETSRGWNPALLAERLVEAVRVRDDVLRVQRMLAASML